MPYSNRDLSAALAAAPAQAAGAAPHPNLVTFVLVRDARARAPRPNVPVVHELIILDSPTRPVPTVADQLLHHAQTRDPTPNVATVYDLVNLTEQTPDANAPEPAMAPANIGLPQEQDMANGPGPNMPLNPMPGSPNPAMPDLPVATEPRNLQPEFGAAVRPTAASRLLRRRRQ